MNCISKKKKENTGITIIALVVTIIVLIILAGVSTNLLLGNNGIITRAKQGSEEYKISEILEKLELEKSNLVIIKEDKIETVKEYIDYLLGNEIIIAENIEDVDENIKNIVIDGYIFLVEQEADGNIKISYQKKADGKPKIAEIKILKVQPDSITIKVIASQVNGGKYTYKIKNITEGETNYIEKATNVIENEYQFEGLALENEYMIQVTIENNNGRDTQETKEAINTKKIEVTSITLNKEETSIKKKNSETLIATIFPTNANNQEIVWSSADETIATVDASGMITAVEEGTTTITVTSCDNNEIVASCVVTVFKPQPVYIYKDGVVNLELGGLTEFKQKNGNPTIQYFENYIGVSNSYSSQYSRNGGIGTVNQIDVTDYGRLKVSYDEANEAKSTWFLTNASPLNVTSNVISKTVTGTESLDMDISNFNGSYYIAMWVGKGTAKIKSILLEPK